MDKKAIYLTGGKFNRRKIYNYSEKTRPTSQKIRLAVFNSLYEVFGVGLDLFSGSGAYGFEALSRGLDFVYFNDKNYDSFLAIKENAKVLEVEKQVSITKYDYLKALKYYEEKGINFSVCFLDPPYDFPDEELINILNWINKTQKKDSRVVVERKNSASPLNIQGFNLSFNKTYGNKRVLIYQKN